ncbi:DsbA family protein [Candidatus Gottesmanbacteria bacterium]|nr:DsbA family protein [Candidatus Gottesmanbacteria bacterium]
MPAKKLDLKKDVPQVLPQKSQERKNTLTYVLIGLLVVAAFALGNLYTRVQMLEKGIGGSGGSAGKETIPVANPTQPVKADLVVNDTDPTLGPKDAKVTVIEFADFQCPFCGAFSGLDTAMVQNMKGRDASWEPTVPNLKKDYVNTGKVRFVWKDYPFLGQESTWAAAAARCAQDQGKFWEYHDYLFSHQSGENQGAFSKDNLKKFAAAINLKTADFNNCVDSGKYEKSMPDALSYGQSVGVSGTPATFVNGQLVSGAASYSTFKAMIDAALK